MAATVTELLGEADRLLDPGRFADYCVNGLQVPAGADVETIATGVSASGELFERAAAAGAQLLLVHHGLFWGRGVRAIDATLRARLKILIDADIALAAYHLPLDAHPEIGNNALLGRALGAQRLDPFGREGSETIGFLARLPGVGVSTAVLVGQIEELTAREPLVLGQGPETVRSLAIVSGAGSDYLQEAAAAGAEALLTGEPNERAMAPARELGIHLIAAGHYATETFGIRRLGDHLAERFGLRHTFIDVPNPV
jgi:dinuclear metal center YbgI/SA1388 family protein